MGGIVTKTVTRNPRFGNPQHRTAELPGVGMLNSIGLQNPGLDYFLEVESVKLQEHGIPIILSYSAESSQEFGQIAELVENHPNGRLVSALELNLSCPNVDAGGIHFGTSCPSVTEALRAVTGATNKPVFAKLTPNVSNIVAIAEAAVEGGAHGLTAINTVMGAAIDIRTRKPKLARVSGGYSGPGIKPIAIHAVWSIHKALPDVPIIAVGGISTTDDVLEFIMAGASLVQVGTACFRYPMCFSDIHKDLLAYARCHQLGHLSELKGCAHQQPLAVL
jgi:dihydroorotate dehydrogenase (NAD+) catalytic subunit